MPLIGYYSLTDDSLEWLSKLSEKRSLLSAFCSEHRHSAEEAGSNDSAHHKLPALVFPFTHLGDLHRYLHPQERDGVKRISAAGAYNVFMAVQFVRDAAAGIAYLHAQESPVGNVIATKNADKFSDHGSGAFAEC